MGGKLADSLIRELMLDDRVARNLDALVELCLEELDWLDLVSEPVWQRLSRIIGDCHESEVKSLSMRTAHTSFAFVNHRVFEEARQKPWALARGDIPANLDSLASSEAQHVEGSVTWKVKQLLDLGFSASRIKQGLALLLELPWSVKPSEDLHGSLACVHRLHPTMSGEMVSKRAFLHMFRRFVTPSKDEREQLRLEARVRALSRKAPHKTGAKQMFTRDFLAQANQMCTDGVCPNPLRQAIIAKHGSRFRLLSPDELAGYESQARDYVEQRRLELREDLVHARTAASLHAERCRVEQASGPGHHCDLHKLTQADYLRLAEILVDDAEMPHLRSRAWASPLRPSATEIETFQSVGVLESLTLVRRAPDWVKKLCQRRYSNLGVAFTNGFEEGAEAFLFMHASQNPQYCLFLRVRHISTPLPVDFDTESAMGFWSHMDLHRFAVARGEYCIHWDLVFPESQPRFVVPDITFKSSFECISNNAAWELDDWLALRDNDREATAEPKPNDQARMPSTIPATVLEEYPWLREYLREGTSNAVSPSAGAVEACMDDEVEAVWAKLEEARVQRAHDGLRQREGFFIRTRSGSGFGGLGYDTVWTEAVRGTPREWCIRYGMQQSISLSCERFGDVNAVQLGLAWCHRLQYFHDIWLVSGNPVYEYSQADRRSYIEDVGFKEFVRGLNPSSESAKRAESIRLIFPGMPR